MRPDLIRKAVKVLAEMAAAADETGIDTLVGSFFQNSGHTTEEIVRKALDGDSDAHLFLCRQAGAALEQGQPMPRGLRLMRRKSY
jgi:hypothetical protein